MNFNISNTTQNLPTQISEGIGQISSDRLGYGIGQLAKQSFDYLFQSWQKLWEPSHNQALPKRALKRHLQATEAFSSSFNLTTLDGNNGIVMSSPIGNDGFSQSTSVIGDFNNDGLNDLLIGAPYSRPDNSGAAYIVFGSASAWPTNFNLSATIDGQKGFKVVADLAHAYLGSAVAPAGDLNSDGISDLVVSSWFYPNGQARGKAYILFGKATGWAAQLNLTSLNSADGFSVAGLDMNYYLGARMSSAGDLNGDGKEDLLLGAPVVSKVYALFSQNSVWPAEFNLTSLDGNNGLVFNGNYGDQIGLSVSSAGDVNDDGLPDLIFGGTFANPSSLTRAGNVCVIFGQSSWPAQIDLSTLNGTTGFWVEGLKEQDVLGSSAAGAGDINGDGVDDLVMGAPNTSGFAFGTTYVIFGTEVWPAQFNLSTLNGTNGFSVKGLQGGDRLGTVVAAAGDFNGDAIDDLVIGAWHATWYTATQGMNGAGAAYVIYGKRDSWTSQFDLSKLNGTNGFVVNGPLAGLGLTQSISAGDINNDGISDIVLGTANPPFNAYILYGFNSSIPVPSFFPSPAIPSPLVIPSPQPTPTPLPQPLPVAPSSPLPFSPSQQLSPSPSQQFPLSSPSPIAIATPIYLDSPPSETPISSPIFIDASPSSFEALSQEQIQNMGIGAGVGGAVLLLGLTGIIGLLKSRRKACFAGKRDPDDTVEMGLMEPDKELFILPKEIKMGPKISEGNFGTVYKGMWQNVAVAIKELKSELSSETQAKLFKEITLMAKLRSPYVVKFYGVTKEQPYKIVMQFMEGGSLYDFLKKNSVTAIAWGLRYQISHDISQGLNYLHQRKIVHADLKSPNVLLDSMNHAKIADFGLASIKSDDNENPNQLKGSLAWMAPELYGNKLPTHESDIYSMGVLLWEMATHRLPFENKKWGPKELITQIVQGKREKFPEATPAEYKKLAQSCWNSDPSKRPHIDDVVHTLSDLWTQSQDSVDSSEDAKMAPDSKLKPAYLTATLGQLPAANKPINYEMGTQTKFGV